MTGPGVPCHFSHLYLLSPGQYTQEIDQALYNIHAYSGQAAGLIHAYSGQAAGLIHASSGQAAGLIHAYSGQAAGLIQYTCL